MQENSWITLFRRIPENLHDSLSLTLVNGMEIVIQRILKLDADFAVVRGRMAGTQDQGRVAILPYHQFLSVSFTRRMTDPEVAAIFGKGQAGFAAAIALDPAQDPDAPLGESEAAAEEEDVTVNGAAADVKGPAKPEMPSKSILLAKLRARLTDSSAGK